MGQTRLLISIGNTNDTEPPYVKSSIHIIFMTNLLKKKKKKNWNLVLPNTLAARAIEEQVKPKPGIPYA